MFKFPFIPKEQKFFNLFEQSTHNLVQITQALKEMVDNWGDIEKNVDKITTLEHTGDTITHQIMEQLNRTFVTPFDREDIATLAHSLDDVTDFVYAAAVRILIYKIEHSTPKAKDLAGILVQASLELEKAIPQLRHRAELKKTLPHCVEINRLENVADDIFRAAQAELFNDTNDLALIIKWREIYEYMESATDRCEDVSNVLEGVTLKYA